MQRTGEEEDDEEEERKLLCHLPEGGSGATSVPLLPAPSDGSSSA